MTPPEIYTQDNNAVIAAQPRTALQVILDWSKERPMWQRDALRRIVQSQKLNENDIADLVALCKRGRTPNPADDAPKPQPLEASHLPANPGAGASVSLTAITDVVAVNNLASGQTLPFASNGITVVYGDNGAGKSGYARLLKRACRARHTEVILPNVYGAPTSSAPSATLCFNVGGAVQPPDLWQDTGKSEPQPHAVLSAISVFDSECAAVHLKGKNEVAFRPFGLDVPDELGVACKQVKAFLDTEKKQHESARNAIFASPPWKAETRVGKALAALSDQTDIKALKELALLSDDEKSRLTRLNEDLSKNPATAAAKQRLKADRIKRLRDALRLIATATGDEALGRLSALHDDAITKRATAKLAAGKLFGTDSLPDIGGEVWRTLWEAARRYSTEIAYPTDPFPPNDTQKLCVLCQQPLSAEAIQRMGRFEAFIRDDTERQAQEAGEEWETAALELGGLAIRLQPIADSLREVELQDKALVRSIRRALASARLRRYVVLRREPGDDQAPIRSAKPFPDEALATLEKQVKNYADDLEKAATADERKALEAERQELADRTALHEQMPAIEAEIERLKDIRFLDDCLSDTTTNAITKLGNDIADEVLTPRLRDKFAEELIGLVSAHIRVEMIRAGGQYGSPQYQIQLLAKPNAKVPDILSEGEQTCVAIAAFLAELATAPHKSALVFDDPISSLDHRWRHKVADRLVAEAATRQVIVFTHDLVFLNDIIEGSQRASINCEARHIRRSSDTVGLINSDLPWDGMKVLARVDSLEKQARDFIQAQASTDDDNYKRDARHFYDDLRASWERALEEVAFAHVVMRHRDYINARHLLRASVLTDNDCKLWSDNFQKCCDYIASHDGSRGRNRAMPEPAELLKDVEALGRWVRDLQTRQKAVEAAQTATAPVA